MFRTVTRASAALTTAMLPIFLVGALTGELRADLGFDEGDVGAALTLLFVVAGIAATPAGRITERLGAAWALRLGVALAGCVLLLVGAWATTWWRFALPLAAVGIAIGLVDTGSARAFSDRLTAGEHGRAFGLKEASVPAASLLAGLAVPAIAAPYGWRSTFMATAILAALVLAALARFAPNRPAAEAKNPAPAAREPAPAPLARSTLALAAGAGLGAGAATAATAFLVPALSARGIATPTAGLILAAASGASIAVRIAAGLWADRPGARPIPAVILLCTLGSLAAAVLAFPVALPLAALAAIVAIGAGWGWTGLVFLIAVRANAQAPAAASGVILSGLALGGALGPIAFGGLAATLSYTPAWIATAAALAIAALTAFLSRRSLSRGSAT